MSIHRSIPSGSCLITLLASSLAKQTDIERMGTCVLLPTRRLQVHLAARLAVASGGASWLPVLQTWDEFVSETSVDFSENNMVMVSTSAELLLQNFLKLKKSLHVNERHAHELLHLIKELWRADVRQTALASMDVWLERQWFRTDDALAQIRGRLHDVFAVIQGFEDALTTHGLILADADLTLRLRAWKSAIAEGAWKPPCERLIVAGLTSLPRSQLALIERMRDLEGVEFWLDEPHHGASVEGPLPSLRRMVGLGAWDPPQVTLAAHALHACQDPTEECAVAMDLATKAIEAGIPAERVAIIVPDESTYASTLARLISMNKLSSGDTNIPLARPWTSTMPGQWLSLLREWTRESHATYFLQLITNPCTNVDDKNSSGLQDMWGPLLALLPLNLTDPVVLQEVATRIGFAAEDTDRLLSVFTMLGGPSRPSFSQACSWWLEYFAPHIEAMANSARTPLETTAWSGLTQAADTILKLPPGMMDQAPWSWADFIHAMHTLAAGTAVRDTGEPLSGLQVLTLTEARYVPFAHAIIMGCVEGSFPHALPRDTLVDNHMKEAMGLTGWQYLEALEDTTFHLLMRRIPHVELTWPLRRGEDHQVRARWIEQMVALGQPVQVHGKTSLYKLLTSDRKFSSSDVDSTEGQVTDLESLLTRISASSLQKLLQCPYRFLLESRGVRPLQMPAQEDQTLTGTLLHKVVELFFDPRSIPIDDASHWRAEFATNEDFTAWATLRLRTLTRKVLPKSLWTAPVIQQIWYRGWPALAQHWQGLWHNGWNLTRAMTEHRIAPDPDAPLRLAVGERTISVTGAMDLVLPGHDGSYLLTDYKSATPPTPREVQTGSAPLLILYSLCLAKVDSGRLSSMRGIAGYWNMRDGTWHTAAVGGDVAALATESGLATSSKSPFLEVLASELLLRWQGRNTSVAQTGRFLADPSNCGYCGLENVCRKNDPRHKDRIAAQALPQQENSPKLTKPSEDSL